MTKHTLGHITIEEMQVSYSQVLGNVQLNADLTPITLHKSTGVYGFYGVQFEGTRIAKLDLDHQYGRTSHPIILRFNDFVPEAVQAPIARRLDWIVGRIQEAYTAQVLRERNAHQNMVETLGPVDHPKVKAPTTLGWRELGALSVPGMVAHLLGPEFEMRHLSGYGSAYEDFVNEIRYVDEDITFTAMRIVMPKGGGPLEIWGRGNRERARSTLGEHLLISAHAAVQRVVADEDLAQRIDMLAPQMQDVYAEEQDRMSPHEDHKFKMALGLETESETGWFRPQPDDFLEQHDWAVHSCERNLPIITEVEIAPEITARLSLRSTNGGRSFATSVWSSGVPIFDSRSGFVPGITPQRRALLCVAAETALADAHPDYASTLPRYDQENTAENTQEARLQRRLLATFANTPNMEM